MKNILERFFLKRYAYIWILAGIILLGIFFRTYHFGDWLQFKGDAFRDATLVSNVYDGGIASLPLLGPRAAGTMLRLGPVFYEFQYASALIFQSVSAPVLAYPDVFFSILTIPLFFFLSRRYFSPLWSLSMAALLSVSFLAIEYGRFAWNPNSTLFFTLLFSYALLRLYDTESEKQRPLLWAALAGIGLAVASQLHFSAFLGLPLVLLLFMVFHIKDSRKVLSYKVILVFFLGILIIYAPVFISEFFKNGENTRLFFSSISKKSAYHGLLQNIFEVTRMFARYFARIGLGLVSPGNKLLLLSGIFCWAGFLANVYLLRKEKNNNKRNFLQWTLILFVVYFLLYIPLAFKINRPRFYLPFMILPYVYVGFLTLFLREKLTRYPRLIALFALLSFSTLFFSNMRATVAWFSELRNSEETATSTGERNSKGTSFFLTWGHYEKAARVMDASCEKQNDISFSMAKGVAEFDHSIEYALLERKRQWKESGENVDTLTEPPRCYYFISFPREPLPKFVVSTKQDAPVDVGNLQIIRLYPEGNALDEFNDEEIIVERKSEKNVFIPEKTKRYSRVFWGDVWYHMSQ